MRLFSTLVALATASLTAAQSRTAQSSLRSTATAGISSFVTSATAVPTGQACAAVSSILARQSAAPLLVRADLAYECARSAPINVNDALRLIDGIVAALQFQSDVGHLKNPPPGYLLAGVDLFGEIANLRSQVSSGALSSEIDFEGNFTAILNKAHDGHLSFKFDGLSVFQYVRQFQGLVSVSTDGKSLPSIYLLEDFVVWQRGGGEPSPVTQVNGQDVVAFLESQSQNLSATGTFQDPDALYNNMFYNYNDGSGGSASAGFFTQDSFYIGSDTTISFSNGSSTSLPNIAVYSSSSSFTGLRDGQSFYNLFCNFTVKAIAQGYDINNADSYADIRIDPVKKKQMMHQKREVERLQRRQTRSQTVSEVRPTSTFASVTRTASAIPGYPTPVALSDDLTLSGYFLEQQGFEDTAVLVIQQMSEEDPQDFQDTMTDFMNQCRSQNKKHLVIDVQGNPGGTISLAYEIFLQLFPNIYPYGAGTLRAHEGLDTLGKYYTNFTSALAKQTNNQTLLAANDYYTQYSAESYANSSGQLFQNWQQLYGPVVAKTDNFTNLIRLDINNTDYSEQTGGIALTGYGTEAQASPFAPENVIILSDGRCSSACTILSHLLKWQGKVKSIAVGGRPLNGAMQSIGGTKGSQVYQYISLQTDVYNAHTFAGANGFPNTVKAIESSKTLGPIYNDSLYVVLRGANAGQGTAAMSDFQFNWQNNHAEGDSSYTPLQFVYEAADCRLWYQPSHVLKIQNLWATTAAQAFGLNNTQVFSLCVQGSTNAPSSLSGNATLFNGGKPNNVTTFLPQESGEGGHGNVASRYTISLVATLVAIAAAIFAL